jgi:hypothetical protein
MDALADSLQRKLRRCLRDVEAEVGSGFPVVKLIVDHAFDGFRLSRDGLVAEIPGIFSLAPAIWLLNSA